MKRNLMKCLFATLVCLFAINASCSKSSSSDEPDPTKLKSVTIVPDTFTIAVGKTTQLSYKITPETAVISSARWSSHNSDIASVDENGLVKGIAVGRATMALAVDGVKATSTVTVVLGPVELQNVTISQSSASLKVGGTVDLTLTPVPANAAISGSAVWKSSNTSVATVTQSGHVVGVSSGSATISAVWGGITVTCTVEVYVYAASRTFTFLQLNLWEGMSNVSAGQEALIKQLATLQPDAASFCEFRSLSEAQTVLANVAKELKSRTGLDYYYTCRTGSGTRGLLTRHTIKSTDAVASSAWFYRTIIDFYGKEIALYASHSYYSYYSCYLPRGYGDGGSPYNWDKISAGPITDVALILQREELSGRTQIGKDLVADAKVQQTAGRLSIFGGDLNEPSHLDWTEAMKNSYEHNGCVVAWPVSTVCYAGGLRDAFRVAHPDPTTYPGVTWPVSNVNATKITQWAADADERDRIDYVYYMPDTKISVTKAQLVGPSAMIAKSKVVEDTFVNKSSDLIEPVGGVWPSDHRGLFITFQINYE